MLTDESFLSLLERLLEKSRADKVNWTNSGRGNMYHVEFRDGSTIVVTFQSPPSEPDSVVVELITRGKLVYAVRREDGARGFKILRALYEEAFRNVTGWEAAIQQIEEELDKDGDIGIPDDPGFF